MTKQVEEDKRSQRKRTADELEDEEMDKGKVILQMTLKEQYCIDINNTSFLFAQVKKVKTKEESRESSPVRNGYSNPFQQFQDRSREQTQNHHNHYHKPDHFKNDFSRNHNRNGYQGYRGGRGGRGGRGSRGGRGRGGGSDNQYGHRRPGGWRPYR